LLFDVPTGQEPRLAFSINAGTPAVLLKLDTTSVVQYVPGSTFPATFFEDAASGSTQTLRIHGYPTDGSNFYGQFQCARPTFNAVATNLFQISTTATGIEFLQPIYILGGKDIVLSTTTGTKIGTATTQLLGFYNATPVDQPATVADAAISEDHTGADHVNIITLQASLAALKTTIGTVIDRLQELGLIA
jgi:hypothetical protein